MKKSIQKIPLYGGLIAGCLLLIVAANVVSFVSFYATLSLKSDNPAPSIMWVQAKGQFGNMGSGIIMWIFMSTNQRRLIVGRLLRRPCPRPYGEAPPLHLFSNVFHIDGLPIGRIHSQPAPGRSAC